MPTLPLCSTRKWSCLAAGLVMLASACAGERPGPANAPSSAIVLASRSNDDDVIRYDTPRKLLFLPLLEFDERGELRGKLARRWKHSPDGREWTFFLRDDVKWHDGVPVTARDVKFTLELLTDPDVAESTPGSFRSVEVIDDTTLTVRAREAWTGDNWTWEIALPEHRLKDLDRKTFRTWEFWKAPIGNGPYRFSRFVPRTMVELEANPDHYDGQPKIDRVIVKLVGDAGVREMLGGKVDLVNGLSAGDALKLAQDPRFKLYHWFNESAAQGIYWRNDHPLFKDPQVRRALTLAINRPELLRILHLPENTPIPDAVYTPRQFRRSELPAPLPFDRGEATRLLAQAGWQDTNGDGILDKDGRPFRFTLLVPSAFYGTEPAAVFVKDQLQRIGVQAELQPTEGNIARERIRNGDFDAALRIVPMDGNLRNLLGENSLLRYNNPRIGALLERALETVDPAEQDRLYREMTEILRADLPFSPLFPFATLTAAHRRVQGLSSPYRTLPGEIMEQLWLEDDPQ